MKMTCEIIRDLLPLYADGVCSGDSRAAIEAHLDKCESCRAGYEAMKANEKEGGQTDMEAKMKNGLMSLKNRIGKRYRRTVIAAIAAVCAVAVVFHLLFTLPLKELGPEDFSVSAEVYAMEQLPKMKAAAGDDNSVEITLGEDDTGELYRVVIPSMPNAEIALSENLMDADDYVTVISWNSPYILREISFEAEKSDGSTLYVEAVRTTLLNNGAKQGSRAEQSSKMLEMRRISKIIYVDDGGGETVLWQE